MRVSENAVQSCSIGNMQLFRKVNWKRRKQVKMHCFVVHSCLKYDYVTGPKLSPYTAISSVIFLRISLALIVHHTKINSNKKLLELIVFTICNVHVLYHTPSFKSHLSLKDRGYISPIRTETVFTKQILVQRPKYKI